MKFSTFSKKEDVDLRIAEIIVQNRELRKANSAIEAEIAKLNAQLTAKKRAQADQAEIDALTAQIAEKKALLKPYTEPIGPTKFSKREDSEKYIADLQVAAQKAKDKAEKAKEKTTAAAPK